MQNHYGTSDVQRIGSSSGTNSFEQQHQKRQAHNARNSSRETGGNTGVGVNTGELNLKSQTMLRTYQTAGHSNTMTTKGQQPPNVPLSVKNRSSKEHNQHHHGKIQASASNNRVNAGDS